MALKWSGWQDLNPRPTGPKPVALPNCATPRFVIRFIASTSYIILNDAVAVKNFFSFLFSLQMNKSSFRVSYVSIADELCRVNGIFQQMSHFFCTAVKTAVLDCLPVCISGRHCPYAVKNVPDQVSATLNKLSAGIKKLWHISATVLIFESLKLSEPLLLAVQEQDQLP